MRRLGLRHLRWVLIGVCVGLVASRFTQSPGELLVVGILAGFALAFFERRGRR